MPSPFEKLRRILTPGQKAYQETSSPPSPAPANPDEVAFQYIQSTLLSRAEKSDLYDSWLAQLSDLGSGRGYSRFCTTTEADLIQHVAPSLGRRVFSIDSATTPDPTIILTPEIKKIKDSDPPPIVIVRGFDQSSMDRVDPDGVFDGLLRHLVQHRGWVTYLQGSGSLDQKSVRGGSITGSSSRTRLHSQQKI